MDLIIGGCANEKDVQNYIREISPNHTYVYNNGCVQSCDNFEIKDGITCIDRKNEGREFAGFLDFVIDNYNDEFSSSSEKLMFAASNIDRHGRKDAVKQISEQEFPTCGRIKNDRWETVKDEGHPQSGHYTSKNSLRYGNSLLEESNYENSKEWLDATLNGDYDPETMNCRRGVFTTTKEALLRRPLDDYVRVSETLAGNNPVTGHWIEGSALAIFAKDEKLSKPIFY